MEETWKIELGRFFVPLYRALFRGPITLPWLIGLIGLFWTSIAVYFVIDILEVKNKIQTILIAGIMVSNITFISQIATYVYEFDFNACALLLAVITVALWRKYHDARIYGIASICLIGSIGIYQAYIAVTVTLMVWLSIVDLLNEKEIKSFMKKIQFSQELTLLIIKVIKMPCWRVLW